MTSFPYEQSTTTKERQRCYYRLNNEKKLSRRGFYVDLSEEKYINEYGNLILNLILSSCRGGGVSELLSDYTWVSITKKIQTVLYFSIIIFINFQNSLLDYSTMEICIKDKFWLVMKFYPYKLALFHSHNNITNSSSEMGFWRHVS